MQQWLPAFGIIGAGSHGYPPKSLPRPYRFALKVGPGHTKLSTIETLCDCHSLDKSFHVSQTMQCGQLELQSKRAPVYRPDRRIHD
jgi:hypothetical protein